MFVDELLCKRTWSQTGEDDFSRLEVIGACLLAFATSLMTYMHKLRKLCPAHEAALDTFFAPNTQKHVMCVFCWFHSCHILTTIILIRIVI